MYDQLWAGIDLKLRNAAFHLDHMGRSLVEPEGTRHPSMMNAITSFEWQTPFCAYLDAFLSAARSLPDIINCCFGQDKILAKWWKTLDGAEQARRATFATAFDPHMTAFVQLPLTKARNISVHRTGNPSVTIAAIGLFGVTHVGSLIKRVPSHEKPRGEVPPWMMTPSIPLRPAWQEFKIDGQDLFPACRDYLSEAEKLASAARTIVSQAHGNNTLSWPPL